MSRIYDALRKLDQSNGTAIETAEPPEHEHRGAAHSLLTETLQEYGEGPRSGVPSDLLAGVEEVPFVPDPEAHLLDREQPEVMPSEEFRSLRTRLNHLQSYQNLHTIVITSPSPAEGKSFTATNLALTQAHMADNLTLLIDFDFRRPTVHRLLQIERAPGMTDYLLGKVSLEGVIKKIQGTNLYVIPAGSTVKNPLELLNLREVKTMLSELRDIFSWVVLDSPPLLFSADSNLLTTMADGTILVVRIGSTTIDTVTRAVQTLCENNVLGIVVNGARAGELYSRYSYYYTRRDHDADTDTVNEPSPEAV